MQRNSQPQTGMNRHGRTASSRKETGGEVLADLALMFIGARRQVRRREAQRATLQVGEVLTLPGGRRVRVDRPAVDSDPLGEVVYAVDGEPWHVV